MGAQWKVINENYKNLEGKFFFCVMCVCSLVFKYVKKRPAIKNF